MNRLEIIGHLGNDAEVKDLSSNQVINFSVAVSESYINKTTNEKVVNTTWFECAKWGNSTQIAQYLKKGTQVYISGKPKNRAWVNEQGQAIVVNGINVLDITLLGSKQSSEGTAPTPAPSQTQTNPQSNGSPLPNEEAVDDLPFG